MKKSLPNIVAELRYKYHLNMIDVNNVLCQLHIRNNDRGERIGAKHVMIIFEDILPRLGYDVRSIMQKEES